MEYKMQVRDIERNKQNQKEEDKLGEKKAYTTLHVTLGIYYFTAKKITSAIYI